MSLDTTEVGIQAARVMEDLERNTADGDYGNGATVLAAAVIYEVENEDGGNTVGLRCTDDRNVIGVGLLTRGIEALLNPE
jgi:hypothetical protein